MILVMYSTKQKIGQFYYEIAYYNVPNFENFVHQAITFYNIPSNFEIIDKKFEVW